MRIASRVGPYVTTSGIILAAIQIILDAGTFLPPDVFPSVQPLFPVLITVFGLAVTYMGWSQDLKDGKDWLGGWKDNPVLSLFIFTLGSFLNQYIELPIGGDSIVWAKVGIAILMAFGVQSGAVNQFKSKLKRAA